MSGTRNIETDRIHAGVERPLYGGAVTTRRSSSRGPSTRTAPSRVSTTPASRGTRTTPEERAAAGIRDELLRVSVGIESTEDLLADFEQALAASA